MKFLVRNYSCLQNPWLRGHRPQIPVLSVLCPQLNLLNPPPRKKFLGTPLSTAIPLLPLCDFIACYRTNFTFTFTFYVSFLMWIILNKLFLFTTPPLPSPLSTAVFRAWLLCDINGSLGELFPQHFFGFPLKYGPILAALPTPLMFKSFG